MDSGSFLSSHFASSFYYTNYPPTYIQSLSFKMPYLQDTSIPIPLNSSSNYPFYKFLYRVNVLEQRMYNGYVLPHFAIIAQNSVTHLTFLLFIQPIVAETQCKERLKSFKEPFMASCCLATWRSLYLAGAYSSLLGENS